MDMKAKIDHPSDWYHYKYRLLNCFRRANVPHHKLKDVYKLMDNIYEIMIKITNCEIDHRRDHRNIHIARSVEHNEKAHELLGILNENLVLEILMGD